MGFIEQLKLLLPVVVSLILGFLIGFERKQRAKEAGIRTHTIVCMGAALMMIISRYAFQGIGDHDPTRIAAQIITGIGFLGAGIIVYRKNAIHGLTTAAGVWATAGIGMATGAELYILAVGTTILIISTQCLFHMQNKLFRAKKFYKLSVCFKDLGNGEREVVKKLFKVEHFNQVNCKKVDGGLIFDVTIETTEICSSERINELMAQNSFIISIYRNED